MCEQDRQPLCSVDCDGACSRNRAPWRGTRGRPPAGRPPCPRRAPFGRAAATIRALARTLDHRHRRHDDRPAGVVTDSSTHPFSLSLFITTTVGSDVIRIISDRSATPQPACQGGGRPMSGVGSNPPDTATGHSRGVAAFYRGLSGVTGVKPISALSHSHMQRVVSLKSQQTPCPPLTTLTHPSRGAVKAETRPEQCQGV